MIIQQNDQYGIYIIQAKEYLYNDSWLVIYGLQVTEAKTIQYAIEEFNNCLEHALACEGVEYD